MSLLGASIFLPSSFFSLTLPLSLPSLSRLSRLPFSSFLFTSFLISFPFLLLFLSLPFLNLSPLSLFLFFLHHPRCRQLFAAAGVLLSLYAAAAVLPLNLRLVHLVLVTALLFSFVMATWLRSPVDLSCADAFRISWPSTSKVNPNLWDVMCRRCDPDEVAVLCH